MWNLNSWINVLGLFAQTGASIYSQVAANKAEKKANAALTSTLASLNKSTPLITETTAKTAKTPTVNTSQKNTLTSLRIPYNSQGMDLGISAGNVGLNI